MEPRSNTLRNPDDIKTLLAYVGWSIKKGVLTRRLLRKSLPPNLLDGSFDERFLHRTGSDPAMPNPRFAIENWFFGASQFPADYAPIAV